MTERGPLVEAGPLAMIQPSPLPGRRRKGWSLWGLALAAAAGAAVGCHRYSGQKKKREVVRLYDM